MSASFTLSLDVQPPASPSLLINDGAAVTGDRAVWLTLSSADYVAGANDVSQMKIWGSVDPSADLTIGTEESASDWIAFAEQVPVLLSAGAGRKTLYARLRDDVANESPVVSDYIDLDLSTPVVDITTAIDRGRISKISPFDEAVFTWEVNMPVLEFSVRAVPSHGSPHQTKVQIGTTHGSLRTSGNSRIEPGEQVVTTVTWTGTGSCRSRWPTGESPSRGRASRPLTPC